MRKILTAANTYSHPLAPNQHWSQNDNRMFKVTQHRHIQHIFKKLSVNLIQITQLSRGHNFNMGEKYTAYS